ncbi:hypothetical protein EYF80_001861 [Liparis tanakae]|uniref:Uncharacterized protein n=1 Tax=Liparis tanakae TaxID=230148 RepID=A0A4Z2JD50_9TELE|nr:hypothetical protein EYF80_001861 [Liparis tanakae]
MWQQHHTEQLNVTARTGGDDDTDRRSSPQIEITANEREILLNYASGVVSCGDEYVRYEKGVLTKIKHREFQHS